MTPKVSLMSNPPAIENSAVEALPRAQQYTCLWIHRQVNNLLLYIRGPKITLLNAARTNDVRMIHRILSFPAPNSSVNANIKHGKKNDTPLLKAAFHGNIEAMKALLSHGARPNDFIVGHEWEYPCCCGQRFPKGYSPSPYHFTTATVRALLDSPETDPNQLIDRWDLTPLEFINDAMVNPFFKSKWKKHAGEACLMLAKDLRTELNNASKIDLSYFVNSEARSLHQFKQKSVYVSTFARAILFNNQPLIDYLLDDPRMNPALPKCSAKNLLIVVLIRITSESFNHYINRVRIRILSSKEYTEDVLASNDLQYKRLFICLCHINARKQYDLYDQENKWTELSELYGNELNRQIRNSVAELLNPHNHDSIAQ